MLHAKITHVVLCSVYGLYCVHDILCCIHTNRIVYVWNYALCCMHILYCVYKMYMLHTVAYIECMPTDVYLYVNWMHGVVSERLGFFLFFFDKLIVFYIMVYIEVYFCQSASNFNITDNFTFIFIFFPNIEDKGNFGLVTSH